MVTLCLYAQLSFQQLINWLTLASSWYWWVSFHRDDWKKVLSLRFSKPFLWSNRKHSKGIYFLLHWDEFRSPCSLMTRFDNYTVLCMVPASITASYRFPMKIHRSWHFYRTLWVARGLKIYRQGFLFFSWQRSNYFDQGKAYYRWSWQLDSCPWSHNKYFWALLYHWGLS